MSEEEDKPKPLLSCFCSALWDSTVLVAEEDIKRLDLIKGSAQYRSPREQQEVLETIAHHNQKDGGGSFSVGFSAPGGTCCNLARAMSALEVVVSFSTLVGQDEEGRRIKESLDELPFLRAHVHESDSEKGTGHITVLVTPDGERTMLVDLGVSADINREILYVQDLMESSLYHFCGYQWDSYAQKKAIRDAMDLSKSCGGKISLDVADPLIVARHREDFLKLIADGSVGLVFANKEEARGLFGEDFIEESQKVREDAIYVFKLGAEGALVLHRGEVKSVKGRQSIKVVDSTGAGDVLAGGFLAGYLRGHSLELSLELGNYLAGDVITRIGVQLSDEAIAYGKKLLGDGGLK